MKSDAIVGLYESEINVIVDECEQYPTIETGGSLFGFWTLGGGPVVCLATRPGPHAIRTATHFQQDPDFHNMLQRMLWDDFRLQWIGLWHSHHRLHLHELSSGDVGRTMDIAERYNKERFTDLLCYFTADEDMRRKVETNIKPYIYSIPSRGQTVSSRMEVMATESPFRVQLGQLPRLAQPALRRAYDRKRYMLQISTPFRRSRLLPEDMVHESVPSRSSSRWSSEPEGLQRVSVLESKQFLKSNLAGKVASLLAPVMPSLPADLQESFEIEEIGEGLVQLDISASSGEHLRLQIDASGEVTVKSGELVLRPSDGGQQSKSLEDLDSSKYELGDYIKKAIRYFKY